MQISKPLTSLMLAGLLSSGVVACGGGGGNNNPSNPGTDEPGDPTPTGQQISGVAESVGNNVAMYENHGLLYAISNFLLPVAGAAITGLQPIQGGTVELIYVDNEGNQVGDVLATTTTSITGDYSLRLPANIDFSANLVVRITGNSGATLDSQVVSETVNINPISDFLLDRLIANGTNLAALPVNEVVTLRGKVEEFDLTAGADMTEMLEQLNTTVGAFLDTNIAIVQSGVGEGSQVAGDYHYGEFGISLDDSDGRTDDGTSVNRIGADLIVGSLGLTDAGNGKVNVTIADNLDSHFNLIYKNSASFLFAEHTMVPEPEEHPADVDGSGALILSGGFEEEVYPDWGYGYRYPAMTIRMAPLADTGMLMGRIDEIAVRYELDANDALDPSAKHGDEIYYGLIIAGKKSEGLTAASLDGAYGTVGIALTGNHMTGNTQLGTSIAVNDYNGDGTVTGVSFSGLGMLRAPNSAPSVGTDTTVADSEYAVTADGELTLTTPSVTAHGFVANGGQVLVAYSQKTTVNSATPPVATSARHSMGVSVKLPATAPDMAGRSYEFRNIRLGYRGVATILSTLDGGVLTFNEGGTVTLKANTFRAAFRGSDAADLLPRAQSVGVVFSDVPVTVGSNGSIDVASASTGQGALKLDGFVSEDGKILVLRVPVSATTPDSLAAQEMGILVGSLKE